MDVLLEKSLINSHCNGLDSIVVKDAPRMIRMFVARADHDLWRNDPSGGYKFSVALHTHHCDVTLIPIFGEIHNVAFSKNGDLVRELEAFRYTSPINGQGEPGFTKLNTSKVPVKLKRERINKPTYLKASDYHSVFVPYGSTAAWWVWEGKEDEAYSSVVWSDDELEKFSFRALNLPMTEDRLEADLAMFGVYR
jgi:hypothetical protein